MAIEDARVLPDDVIVDFSDDDSTATALADALVGEGNLLYSLELLAIMAQRETGHVRVWADHGGFGWRIVRGDGSVWLYGGLAPRAGRHGLYVLSVYRRGFEAVS